MRAKLLKVSALALAGVLSAPMTLAQEAAEPEAPPPPTLRKSRLRILISYSIL